MLQNNKQGIDNVFRENTEKGLASLLCLTVKIQKNKEKVIYLDIKMRRVSNFYVTNFYVIQQS